MKLWLLEEGEKTGPFESFTVRERVANGELKAETPAWYDGADGWVTLADVPSMTSAFPRKEAELIEFNADDLDIQKMGEHRHGVQIPDQLIRPPALHPLRRFSARMIDVFLYMMLVVAVKLMQGMDIYDPLTASQQFMYSVPYVVIDALMMHLFGTTIGKYFLNIHVSSATGERLTFGASLLRSGRVWVIGLGMFTILMPISFLFSWMLSRKFGKCHVCLITSDIQYS